MTDDELAHKIQSTYVNIRRRSISHFDRSAAVDAAVLKAAVICKKIEAEPVAYVTAQHKYCTGEFWPTMLHSSSAADNYKKYLASIQGDFDKVLNAQLQWLGQIIKDTKQTVEYTLMDPLIDFLPWFRILITKEPNPEIIAKYKEKAKYLMNSRLHEFLKSKKFDVARLK